MVMAPLLRSLSVLLERVVPGRVFEGGRLAAHLPHQAVVVPVGTLGDQLRGVVAEDVHGCESEADAVARGGNAGELGRMCSGHEAFEDAAAWDVVLMVDGDVDVREDAEEHLVEAGDALKSFEVDHSGDDIVERALLSEGL